MVDVLGSLSYYYLLHQRYWLADWACFCTSYTPFAGLNLKIINVNMGKIYKFLPCPHTSQVEQLISVCQTHLLQV
jgi:hypothetical protein